MQKIGLALLFSLRYLTIFIVVLLLVGAYKIESYGIFIIIYYLAINYLAIKYGIIKGIDRIKNLKKNDFLIIIPFILTIINCCLYSIYQFKLLEIMLLTTIPIILFLKIKTEEEIKRKVELNNKKTIEEYFKSKKGE